MKYFYLAIIVMSWATFSHGADHHVFKEATRGDQGLGTALEEVGINKFNLDQPNACPADMEPDGDVDSADLKTLAVGFGRTIVVKDTDVDKDIDGKDMYNLAIDFNRIDCLSTEKCTTGNCVDFSEVVGNVELIYGANEDDAWWTFADTPAYWQYHQDVGTRSIRVWLSAQWYRESTFPYDGRTYDWNNVDKFIDAALQACVGDDPPLYVTFAHYDICGDACENSSEFDFSGCGGHAAHPPSNNDKFANYVVSVIKHFRMKCNTGGYSKPCDVNDWYFEIWNEPTWGGGCWSDTNYRNMFEAVNQKIHKDVEQAYDDIDALKLAAYRDAKNTNGADFKVQHLYADNVCDGNDQVRMNCIDTMFHDAVSSEGLPVVNSEYNVDTEGYSYTDFAASWMAAALINQIKAGIHMEHVYSGTALGESGNDYQYGMWSHSGIKWPVYHMKRQFVTSHPSYPTPATIVRVELNDMSDDGFHVLATRRPDNGRRFITIVNKKSYENHFSLEIINGLSGRRTLDRDFSGFEVVFLEESPDGTWMEVLTTNR